MGQGIEPGRSAVQAQVAPADLQAPAGLLVTLAHRDAADLPIEVRPPFALDFDDDRRSGQMGSGQAHRFGRQFGRLLSIDRDRAGVSAAGLLLHDLAQGEEGPGVLLGRAPPADTGLARKPRDQDRDAGVVGGDIGQDGQDQGVVPDRTREGAAGFAGLGTLRVDRSRQQSESGTGVPGQGESAGQQDPGVEGQIAFVGLEQEAHRTRFRFVEQGQHVGGVALDAQIAGQDPGLKGTRTAGGRFAGEEKLAQVADTAREHPPGQAVAGPAGFGHKVHGVDAGPLIHGRGTGPEGEAPAGKLHRTQLANRFLDVVFGSVGIEEFRFDLAGQVLEIEQGKGLRNGLFGAAVGIAEQFLQTAAVLDRGEGRDRQSGPDRAGHETAGQGEESPLPPRHRT